MSENISGVLNSETDLLKKTVVVKEGESEFEFRIPSILDEVKIGARIRRLRLSADPMDDPGGQIDMDTMAYLKSMAYFEILLVAASKAEWVWSRGPEGKQIVDSTRFPVDKTDQILRVAAKAVSEVNRFRNPSFTREGDNSQQTVADKSGI